MKNVWAIYPDYDLARYGTGLLFKGGVADRNASNIILHSRILSESPSTGNFKEIAGEAFSKGEGGSTPDLPQMKSDQLSWLDHFLADCTIVTMSDTGSIAFAGESVEGHIKNALVEGIGALSPILRKAGLGKEDATLFTRKISEGGVAFWTKIEDQNTQEAESLARNSKAEPIRIV